MMRSVPVAPGKTSVAEWLQLELREPHLLVGLDHFFSMFPHHWKDRPRGSGPGFWYDDTIDAGGHAHARIRYGEAGARLLAGMRAAVCAMLDAGNHVIFGEMPVDESVVPLGNASSQTLRPSGATWTRRSMCSRNVRPGEPRDDTSALRVAISALPRTRCATCAWSRQTARLTTSRLRFSTLCESGEASGTGSDAPPGPTGKASCWSATSRRHRGMTTRWRIMRESPMMQI